MRNTEADPTASPPGAIARCEIRWLLKRDDPQVMAIECQSFPNPWRRRDLRRVLREWGCNGMAAVEGELLLGYMVYCLQKSRVELLNLAVAASCRRSGVGSQLVKELRGKRPLITVYVRERNLAGQLFFRAQGFRATAIVRGYYTDLDEDAIRMIWRRQGEAVGGRQ